MDAATETDENAEYDGKLDFVKRVNPKLYNWASVLDDVTLEQARKTSSMPFIHPHVALMPDAHLGKGATVGSVIPTRRTIIPAAVGVDIGCGMMAIQTRVSMLELAGADLPVLRQRIEDVIPLSPGRYNEHLRDGHTESLVTKLEKLAEKYQFDPGSYASNWRLQLGSLGGGNHFIEVVYDQEGRVWLFLHSGSRGVGNKIAQHHIKIAVNKCDRYWIQLPDPDLAYLVEGDEEFWRYMLEMRWAQQFAFLNRQEMMNRVRDVFEDFIGGDTRPDLVINCHHNYTEQETHYGEKLWISRKGAIKADDGDLGLIPGSMGTPSYVVEGLGNRLSLNSAPHGAGRVHSRRKARENFTHEQLRERMGDIVWRDSEAFLDEIPDAYKNIDTVMEDAKGLVKPLYELKQLVNVKGE